MKAYHRLAISFGGWEFVNKCKCISKYWFFGALHKTYRSNFGLRFIQLESILSFQSFAAEIHLLKVALRIDISIVPKVDLNV